MPKPAPETPVPISSASQPWTNAQLEFLSGFLHGSVFTADGGSYWTEHLREHPAKTVQRMIDAGMLTTAPLAAKLDGAFKATEIKSLLRERSLPVSGKKADCIERLVAADAAGMEAKVAGITTYVCTDTGMAIAEKYVALEDERNRVARDESWRRLCAGDVRGALGVVAEFERAQVFQRGLGVNWHNRPSREDVELTEAILRARPAILKDVVEADWRALQVAAVMLEMWGERSAKAWLPETFTGPTNLHREVAARMVLFAGQHQARLAQYCASGISKLEVSGCGESSCPACQQVAGRKYRTSDLPELPFPRCTSEMGCRCMVLPVFD